MNISRKYFGTDGIRGRVGDPPITADFMLKLGWAIGTVLASSQNKKVIIGKDTRVSGYMIESALQAGLAAAGIKIYLLGPMPTGGIAYLTQTLSAGIGIVISASHHSYDNNGIKLFSGKGFELSVEKEAAIEAALETKIITASPSLLGKAKRIDDAAGRYIEYCKSAVPHHTFLKNFKLSIDCANGATYHIAPHVFSELGVDVTSINILPNGFNINKNCGLNHPEIIQRHVLENHADMGVAFNGDGDSIILVDNKGEILNGDEILYVVAKGLVDSKNYSGGVVGTQQNSAGLERALQKIGLSFSRVATNDQHIVEELIKNKWQLGGDALGHIIHLGINTTSDGIIAALLALNTMHVTGKSLHELKKEIKK